MCVCVCVCVCVRVCAHPASRRSCAGRSAGLPAPKVMSRACRHPNQRPSAHPSLPGWALRSNPSILPPGHIAPCIVHGSVHRPLPFVLPPPLPVTHPSGRAHRYSRAPWSLWALYRALLRCARLWLRVFFQTPHYHAMLRCRAPAPDISHRSISYIAAVREAMA